MENNVLNRKKGRFFARYFEFYFMNSSSVTEEREKEKEFIGREEAKDNQSTEVTMKSMTEKKITQSRVGPSPSPTFPTSNPVSPWSGGRGPICLS